MGFSFSGDGANVSDVSLFEFLVDFVDEDGAFEGDVDLVFVGGWVGVSDSETGVGLLITKKFLKTKIRILYFIAENKMYEFQKTKNF